MPCMGLMQTYKIFFPIIQKTKNEVKNDVYEKENYTNNNDV